MFYFGTQSGYFPSGGFECQLLDSSGGSGSGASGGLHAWQSCTSPTAFQNLVDGTYVFQVCVGGGAGGGADLLCGTYVVQVGLGGSVCRGGGGGGGYTWHAAPIQTQA